EAVSGDPDMEWIAIDATVIQLLHKLRAGSHG
ncbi:MAG: hypothetical protein FD119_336, partial [Stygiobacter sp.]